jgi:phosphoribosylformylglycinamidine synthase
MAQAGGVGAELDLDAVKKMPDDLPAEVIACSETQERYAMFVPSHFTATVVEIYNERFDLPHIYSGAGAYVIGHVTSDPRFKLKHRGRLVCDAHVDVITTGISYDRESRPRARALSPRAKAFSGAPSMREAFLALLSSHNVADKSILFRHYDSEVQGRAVLRPGEADAAVAVFIPGEPVGVATGIGGISLLGAADPYLGGAWAVVEAVRNIACVGARALAITDCLNYGDPEQPEVFWEFSEGVRGIGDACRKLEVAGRGQYGIPVISGNVSFYNQSEKGRPIAPTPIVAAAGRVEDVSVCRGMGFKSPGSKLVLLGEFHDHLGGSEYLRCFAPDASLEPPVPDFSAETVLVRSLVALVEEGIVLAAHDVSHGGLLVTLAEMAAESLPFAVGCAVDLSACLPGGAPADGYLFGELGGVVVEIDAARWADFERLVSRHGARWTSIGVTTPGAAFSVRWKGGGLESSIGEIDTARRVKGRCNALFA